MHQGRSYFAIAVKDNKLGEYLLELNPTLTRPQLLKAKLDFKRAIGNKQFDTEKKALTAWLGLSVTQCRLSFVTECTPIFGIL